jgi:hypothetical protein
MKNEILKTIENMTRGQKEFYNFESQEQIDQVFKFLCDIEYDVGIRVEAHRESQTGNRNIDLVIVTKL